MRPIIRRYKAGDYLFREGDSPSKLYFIRKGVVSIRKRKAAKFVELAQLGTNQVLGELGFFNKQPRNAGAICLINTEVLEIDYSSLDKVYSAVPDYLQTIMSSVCDRLRKADDAIRRLSNRSVLEGDRQIVLTDYRTLSDNETTQDQVDELIDEHDPLKDA